MAGLGASCRALWPSDADLQCRRTRSCWKLIRSHLGLNRTRCGKLDTVGPSARVAKFTSGPRIRMRPNRRPKRKLRRLKRGERSTGGTVNEQKPKPVSDFEFSSKADRKNSLGSMCPAYGSRQVSFRDLTSNRNASKCSAMVTPIAMART